MTDPQSPSKSRPWWTHAYVWLILAGPAIVVVAGFYTYYLAARTPDPVLPTHVPTQAQNPQATGISQAPAVQARNHAATGEWPASPRTSSDQAAPSPAAAQASAVPAGSR